MDKLISFIFILSLSANAQGSRSMPSSEYDFIVAVDGSADFTSVQAAFNAVPDYRKNRTTIFIRNGVYKEKLVLPASKTNVRLVGEDKFKTILTYDDFAAKKNRFGEEIGTTGSSSFFLFADEFMAENLTFANSAGPVGQAVAMRVDGDRVIFVNCRFLGFQDTLYPHGEKSRQYYKDCYIEGTTDFIFGWSTAVFENCTVFCKKGGQYMTAASTPEANLFGFVFINCKITGDAPEKSYYLGRPWRDFARTVFINCFLDKHVRPEGWHNWNKPQAEQSSFYGEFRSSGPGSDETSRVPWSHILNDEEAERYSVQNIFADWKLPRHGS
jgi:pectinesterase